MADENKDRAAANAASAAGTSPFGSTPPGGAGREEDTGAQETGGDADETREEGIGARAARSAAEIADATERAANAADWTYRHARDTLRDSRAVIRGQVFERPLISVAAVGLFGFALGWICRGSAEAGHHHGHHGHHGRGGRHHRYR